MRLFYFIKRQWYLLTRPDVTFKSKYRSCDYSLGEEVTFMDGLVTYIYLGEGWFTLKKS